MGNWTPGPWKVVDRGVWDISVEAGGTVCHVNNKGEWFRSNCGESISGRSQNRLSADARLIAAAPELLEALRGMVALAEGMNDASNEGGQLDGRYDVARAAIAKATGGQP